MTPGIELVLPAPQRAVKVKPALRGVFHFLAFFLSLGGIAELAMAPAPGWRHAAGIVYAVSLTLMLGLSATYHRPMWSHAARARLRLIDHCGIFLLIAGSYTPFAAFASPETPSWGLLGMWAGALVGIAHVFLNNHGNRVLRAGVYVVLGLSAAPLVFSLPASLGWPRVLVLLLGSAVYIAGAGVYAMRWPNPKPSVFGYHEIFHLLVLVAAALHFGVIWSVQQLP